MVADQALLERAVDKFMGTKAGPAYASAPGTTALIAITGPEISGWCWGYHLIRPDDSSMLYLHQLKVDEAYRRQGIGRDLLRTFMTTGAQAGATKMFLTTGAENAAARALYEGYGRRPGRTRPHRQLLVPPQPKLVTWGFLSDLTSETFTVVGYGTDAYITGSALSPKAITVYDGARSYRDVSVITNQDRLPRPVREDHEERLFRRLRRTDVPRRHARCAQHLDIQPSLRRTEPWSTAPTPPQPRPS
ncbi:acetyltransferase (GNAT) family protein [Kribbella sp. VKM Ac-2527]|uniref:Acetyltransferase (GNAT) family protein n=1 Tax=Kribbella caucasensis TaxID=2512215 RepID=A0A4V3C6H8_9ACTN|nr:GNAT family N-acetyltransferase [Kribbella sp. VKM Ac-2527]TDO33808.1 acetyltransferase (GNAT) family protein [Kribbella sp. VKM Ac-2527]